MGICRYNNNDGNACLGENGGVNANRNLQSAKSPQSQSKAKAKQSKRTIALAFVCLLMLWLILRLAGSPGRLLDLDQDQLSQQAAIMHYAQWLL